MVLRGLSTSTVKLFFVITRSRTAFFLYLNESSESRTGPGSRGGSEAVRKSTKIREVAESRTWRYQYLRHTQKEWRLQMHLLCKGSANWKTEFLRTRDLGHSCYLLFSRFNLWYARHPNEAYFLSPICRSVNQK